MKWLFAKRGSNLISLIFIVSLVYGAFFTGSNSSNNKKHTTTQLLMGTLVSITTWGVEDKKESKAVADAFLEIARVESLMSSHKKSSQVSLINLKQSQIVDKELLELIKEAQRIKKLSNGAFDLGLGKLITMWGFSTDNPPNKPPEDTEIASWLNEFKEGDGIAISEKNNSISITKQAIALDLGGIAKGYAIDRAIVSLKKSGVQNALVNAGGDLRGIGKKGDKPWRVGIQHPRKQDKLIVATQWSNGQNVDMAMVTSGDYERFFIYKEKRYHHILNPKNGYPAKSGLQSVSVQTNSATLADGLSTAFFVLGEKASKELLKQIEDVEILIVRSDGTHWQSKGFRGEWL
ncbi:MAG: FAD:protein FMN transferase [Magnetococcales bacterium]|nr:FAD:protein FMN transferase [Magnetococcales bacterium]